MTEQAGYLNAPDLVEELAAEAGGVYDGWVDPVHTPNRWPVAVEAVNAVLSVLRKRGLLTIQALELLADK